MNGTNDGGWGGGQGAPGGQPQPYPGMGASGGGPPGGGQGGGPYGSPPGGGSYGGPPGGGNYGGPPGGGPPGGGGFGGAPPPGGGGFGAPPGGGGFGQPPGGGGFGAPPPGGGGFGGAPPPGGGGFGGAPPPGGGGFGGAPPGGGGFGQPPGGGFGGPPGGYGTPPPYVSQVPGQSMSGQVSTEPLAIGSFIVGLISVPGSFCCSFAILPVSLAAVVTGIMAFGKARQRNDQLGKLLAIAGIGTGAVGILLLIVFLALGMAGALFRQLG
jgi:uncharacterized protein DUF4190